MLALAHGGEVAQTVHGGGLEGLDLTECLFAEGSQLAQFLCFTEGVAGTDVTVFGNQPTGTVPAVVTHVEWLIAFGGGGEWLVGQATVVVQILTARQILVGFDFFAGSLCGDGNCHQGDCEGGH